MKIAIANRLRPFSHQPGAACLIPGTLWQVQAFPTRFVFTSPEGEQHLFNLPLSGPVQEFTLLQDLERAELRIFGRWQEGFFEWRIDTEAGAIWLRKRRPEKEAFRIAEIKEPIATGSLERLSFGCHKSQDWEKIQRRQDLREILPFWLRLSQLTPVTKPLALSSGEILDALNRLFKAHFRPMLLPTLTDDLLQGFKVETASPLHEGAKLIRDALFREEKDAYAILPALPSSLHVGRFLNIQTASGDTLDLEWTKGQIRRLIIRPAATRTLSLILPPSIRSFRLGSSRHAASQPLNVQAGQPLYLDRFEK